MTFRTLFDLTSEPDVRVPTEVREGRRTAGGSGRLLALGTAVMALAFSVPAAAQCGSTSARVSTLAGLREALVDACIQSIAIAPGTYELASDGGGQMVVSRALSITNGGGGEVLLDGGGTQRVLEVRPSGSLSIVGLTIQNGFSSADGGGILNAGSLTIDRSLFNANRSDDDGAGLQNNGGTVVIRNSTFSANVAGDDGGGFESNGGSVRLVHVTMAGNRSGPAASETGDAFNLLGGATAQVVNSLLSDDFGGESPLVAAPYGSVTSNGGNLVDAPTCSFCVTGDLRAPSGLGPLLPNGGEARTHQLLASSAGLHAAIGSDGLPIDQRGIFRPQGPGLDIGAYERVVVPPGVEVTLQTDEVSRLPSNGVAYAGRFTVANTGGSAARYALEATADPSILTIDSVRGPGLTFATPSDSALTASIAPGDSVVATVWYRVDDVAVGSSTPLILTAADSADPPASDDAETSVTVVRPRLGITKVASVAGDLVPGAPITWEVTVTNHGTEGAIGVEVADSIPAQVVYQVGSAAQTLPTGVSATVEFAQSQGVFNYTPTSGGCGAPPGFDDCVRFVRWTLSAPLPSAAGSNQGEFAFSSIIR